MQPKPNEPTYDAWPDSATKERSKDAPENLVLFDDKRIHFQPGLLQELFGVTHCDDPAARI